MLTVYDRYMNKKPFDGFSWVNDEFRIRFEHMLGVTTPGRISPKTSYRCDTDDNGMSLSFDIPGVKPEDISVSVDSQSLSLSYTLRGKKIDDVFTINNDYDPSLIKAKLEHGVLLLQCPRLAKTKQKIMIEIK